MKDAEVNAAEGAADIATGATSVVASVAETAGKGAMSAAESAADVASGAAADVASSVRLKTVSHSATMAAAGGAKGATKAVATPVMGVMSPVVSPVIDSYTNFMNPMVVPQGGGFGAEPEPGKEAVILRLEIARRPQIKAMRIINLVVAIVSLLLMIGLIVIKYERDPNVALRTDNRYFLSFTIISGILLAILLIVFIIFTRRMIYVRIHGMVWTGRRRLMARCSWFILLIQTMNMAAMTTAGSIALSGYCRWQSRPVYNAGFVQWTLWNMSLLFLTVMSHMGAVYKGNLGVRGADGKVVAADEENSPAAAQTTALFMDAPWRVHWPKLVPWALLQSLLIARLVKYQARGIGTACKSGADLVCPPGTLDKVALGIQIFVIWYYFLSCFYYNWITARDIKSRSYHTMRSARLIFGVLREQIMPVFFSFALAATLITTIEIASCWTFVESWMGVVPLQLMGTAMACVLAFYFVPKRPGQVDDILQSWLQEFAWTTTQMPDAMAERNAKLAASEVLAKSPMFCYQTAVQLLYWAKMVYNVPGWAEGTLSTDEELEGVLKNLADERAAAEATAAALPGAPPSGTPADVAAGAASEAGGATSISAADDSERNLAPGISLNFALSMFGMEQAEALYEAKGDTKALLAWGGDTILISFRGTASKENAITDLKFFKTIHPPRRYAQITGLWGMKLIQVPVRVHTGFWSAWAANGFNERVLDRVKTIAAEHPDPSKLTVYLTGHSLGGSLATLAAHAVKTALPEVRVVVYSYGQPRVGNSAFKFEYNGLVDEHWSVMNARDPIATIPKGDYHRAGERVIFDRLGNVIVAPTALETHLISSVAPSVNDHMTGTYRFNLMNVLKTQFGERGIPGGALGATALAEQLDLDTALIAVNCSAEALADPEKEAMRLETWEDRVAEEAAMRKAVSGSVEAATRARVWADRFHV